MYRRKAKGWYKHIDFIILDIICLELSFLIAYVIRHGAVNPYHFQLYRSAAIVLGFIDFVLSLCMQYMQKCIKARNASGTVCKSSNMMCTSFWRLLYICLQCKTHSHSRESCCFCVPHLHADFLCDKAYYERSGQQDASQW